MKKYLVSYEKYVDPHWKHFISEVDIPAFCTLLQGVVNDNISDLFIQLKPLRPATEIRQDAAKTLITILSEEQNYFFAKTLDECFLKVDD